MNGFFSKLNVEMKHFSFISLFIQLAFGQSFIYQDLAEAQGLDFVHDHGGSGEKYYVETMGSGVCLIDYDNDDDLDIYFCQGAPLPGWDKNVQLKNRLYRNDNGSWTNVSEKTGVGDTSYSIGCACGDVDNDGDTDLYVTNFGADILYINNGNGTFTDMTTEMGIESYKWGSSAAFIDGDNDGWLDLYVTNYVEFSVDKNPWCGERISGLRAYCDPDIFEGITDDFYHNNGNGTFSNWTDKAGVSKDRGKGLGVVPGDVDNDGDMDVYIANDKVMNLLYINDGYAHFEESALFNGVGFNENGKAEAGMGVDFGDINQNGRLDLFVTNFSGESNTLYLNDGNGSFIDKTFSAGLGQPSLDVLGFGTKFMDINLDGWLDLFVINGHVIDNIAHFNSAYTHAQRKQVFINNQNGTFSEIDQQLIGDAANVSVGRGAAFGDIDNDGDMDIVISNNNQPANLLIKKDSPGNNWIGFELEGISSNRDAIGAKVTIETENGKQISYVNTGASYLASNDKRIVFGLNGSDKIDFLSVCWPGGQEEIFTLKKVNQYYKLVEGVGISKQIY